MKVKSLSCVQLLAIPWTAAYQAPPSMEFYRQEYWSGVPLPSPVGLHRTIQLQLLQHYWLGHRLGLLWITWITCMGALETNGDSSVAFEIAPKYCIS